MPADGPNGLAGTPAEMPATLIESGVVAVLRTSSVSRCVPAIETLVSAGIADIELTMTIPDLIEGLADLVAAFPAATIGVGTLTTADQVRAVVDAGAQFLVTPAHVAEVWQVAAESGLAFYPGAMTPSEIRVADSRGATAVKVFPATTLGPDYIEHVHGPFPTVPLLPSGGISLDAIPAWIRSGAVAVSLGGPLLGDALEGGDLRSLAARATRALDAVREGRPS